MQYEDTHMHISAVEVDKLFLLYFQMTKKKSFIVAGKNDSPQPSLFFSFCNFCTISEVNFLRTSSLLPLCQRTSVQLFMHACVVAFYWIHNLRRCSCGDIDKGNYFFFFQRKTAKCERRARKNTHFWLKAKANVLSSLLIACWLHLCCMQL